MKVYLNRSVSEDMIFDWSAAGLRNEKGLQWERQKTSIFFKEQDRGRSYLSEGRSDDETLEYDARMDGISSRTSFLL